MCIYTGNMVRYVSIHRNHFLEPVGYQNKMILIIIDVVCETVIFTTCNLEGLHSKLQKSRK